jgi:hypothetical protein
MPGLAMLAMHVIGAMSGGFLPMTIPSRQFRSWGLLMAATTVAAAAVQALNVQDGAGAWFRSVSLAAGSHAIQVALAHLPLGFVVAVTFRPVRWRYLSVAGIAAALSTAVLVLQTTVGRGHEILSLAAASSAAVLGAWLAEPGRVRFEGFVKDLVGASPAHR